MILEEGLLHLDLHSGNWGINNNNLIILDFGYSLRIYDKNNLKKKKALQDMWVSMYTRDKNNFISQIINNFITDTYKNDKEIIIQKILEEIKDINIFDNKNMYSIILNFCKKFNFILNNEFYFITYYLTFTIGFFTKYFKFDKDLDDQNFKELYNSHIIISKYEEIIFEQYPLFGKYRYINEKIIENLEKKIIK
jgi:predicted unusual protein kinase regulating ubiquinone biosynthesis (AarF/ABC1/UbiB family)